MVVFGKEESVIRRMHQRRYEKTGGKRWAGQKKRTQAGGGPTASTSDGKERPHSAPLQAQLLGGTGVVGNGSAIEARLGIVKKNRRSNSAIIGLNCVDLTKDDNKDSRKRIIDFIKQKEVPDTTKPVKQRANSVPQAQLTALEMEILQQMEAGRQSSDEDSASSEELTCDASQPFVSVPVAVEDITSDRDITVVDNYIDSLLGDLLGSETDSNFFSVLNLS